MHPGNLCYFSPKEMAEISENWVGGFGGDSTMCYVNVLIQASVRSGEGNGTPLQYSCLENPMDGGAWWAAVHGVAKRHDWATSLSCIGEGNGNSLQCSCLENPRDGGAWWAAVCGVAQSRTRLKRCSSSSSARSAHLPCPILNKNQIQDFGFQAQLFSCLSCSTILSTSLRKQAR